MQVITFVEYCDAIKDARERLERITEALRLRGRQWRKRPLVPALMRPRGFDFVAPTTFVAEIGDPRRFAYTTALMGYLGLVPLEFSSGNSRHQGNITKSGNKHARRILIESARPYYHSLQICRCLEVRQQRVALIGSQRLLAHSVAVDPTLPTSACGTQTAAKQSLRSCRA